MFVFNRPALAGCVIVSALFSSHVSFAQIEASTSSSGDDLQALQTQLKEAVQRLETLEMKQFERQQLVLETGAANGASAFNPQISVVLDGRYTAYSNSDADYHLPGFTVAGEAGLADEGFSLGHTELIMSAAVDDKFFAQLTLAIAEHDAEAAVELEEAFVETQVLGGGVTLRAGRFFSNVGYQNLQHAHVWDFVDAALVYSALWGNKNIDDGLRLSWLLPTDSYWEVGYEAFAGRGYPNGERANDIGSQVGFMKVGGDMGVSHSWLMSFSFQYSDVLQRDLAARHEHGHIEGDETLADGYFDGTSQTWNASLVYKWAPYGNYKNSHFKLQAELFIRDEDGDLFISDAEHGDETGRYEGRLQGAYIQASYHFLSQWTVGLRYDALRSKHQGDEELIMEAGLDDEGYSPKRSSMVADWLPSEFSRLRLQYSLDQSDAELDQNIVTLAYTMSFGSHSAHSF